MKWIIWCEWGREARSLGKTANYIFRHLKPNKFAVGTEFLQVGVSKGCTGGVFEARSLTANFIFRHLKPNKFAVGTESLQVGVSKGCTGGVYDGICSPEGYGR
jgi:hypothetical protein